MGSQEFQLAILFLIWASLTCLSFSLPSEYSILGQEQDKFPAEERVIKLFQQWMKEHKRVYKHAEEAEKRFENFRRNLKYITKNNEEFKKTYLSNVKKPFNKMSNTLLSGSMQEKLQSWDDASTSLDWRKKGVGTGVKDQGDCDKFLYLDE